jgi:hypothetical protein
VCWLLTYWLTFEAWFDIFLMFHPCFMYMLIWCDNACHTIGCPIWSFSLIDQLISSVYNFWYDDCIGHVVCSWKFPKLFESFLI